MLGMPASGCLVIGTLSIAGQCVDTTEAPNLHTLPLCISICMSVHLFGVHLYSNALSGTQKPKGGCLSFKQKQPKWGSGKLRENVELVFDFSWFL